MLLRPEEAKSDTQLVFAWDERIPKGIIDDFMATIDTPELKCVADKRRQRGAYAGVELFIDTAIILMIAKPYFDSFLKEAGRDHYVILKSAILALCEKLLGKDRVVKIEVVVSSNSPLKQSADPFSPAFSIIAPLGSRKRMKFVFRQEMTLEDLDKYTDLILNLVRRVNSDNPYLLQLMETNKNLIIFDQLTMTYNKQSNELIPVR